MPHREQCTCQPAEVFDEQLQAGLIDPARASFSASYTAALLRERQYLAQLHEPARIFTKGADSIMRPLLAADDEASQAAVARTWGVMTKFAAVGLRTLVVGSRVLGGGAGHAADSEEQGGAGGGKGEEEGEFDFEGVWMKSLEAANAMEAGPAQAAELTRLYSQVESGLEMHGCSAIEDKLQEGVTRVLPTLAKAGIKVWVLTGDKTDTAIEIGYSCNLLTRSQNVVVLEEWDPDDYGLPAVPRAYESDADPRVVRHVRDELMRLLRELDEKPDGAPVYGPRPTVDPETGAVAQLPDGTLHFPPDPQAMGLPRGAEGYPTDWPTPLPTAGSTAAQEDEGGGGAELETVWPHIAKRPLKQHPLAIVMHASILQVAMDDSYCDERGDWLSVAVPLFLSLVPSLSCTLSLSFLSLFLGFWLNPLASAGVSVGTGDDADADAASSSSSSDTRLSSVTESGRPCPEYIGDWRGGGGMLHKGTVYRSCLDVFAELGRHCSVVLCCRVSPRQKAEVVSMGKKQFGKITLAIGDGANDVPMIKEAHIGVGISGHEGMQAVLASDYAIGQFQFLERLLLVHGRWSYKRIARLVMYFFYKNTLYAMTATWLCRHNGYSGMSFFDGMVGSAYMLVTTSVPIFVAALFERDIDDGTMLRHPQLYAFSQQGIHLSHNNFLMWAVNALWNSIVIYFTITYILAEPDALVRHTQQTQMKREERRRVKSEERRREKR
eukprot:COSAG05_NODE_510_length_9123_cov_3.605053_1_plen_720_part_10